jgi:hypothetical protein
MRHRLPKCGGRNMPILDANWVGRQLRTELRQRPRDKTSNAPQNQFSSQPIRSHVGASQPWILKQGSWSKLEGGEGQDCLCSSGLYLHFSIAEIRLNLEVDGLPSSSKANTRRYFSMSLFLQTDHVVQRRRGNSHFWFPKARARCHAWKIFSSKSVDHTVSCIGLSHLSFQDCSASPRFRDGLHGHQTRST